jgi:nitroreductase
MELMELIKTRKSVRTFDGSGVKDNDLLKLKEYAKSIENPYGIPVEFMFFKAEENGLSSPVITGEHIYVTAKVHKTEHCDEAFGYSFEKMVLYAWSLGIGTTWIGGTMNRSVFESVSKVTDDEIMMCVSPLGYPAEKRSVKEIAMRAAIQADKRKDQESMFFENGFSEKLKTCSETEKTALEAVRLAPSAVNKQPWIIVKCADSYHFYEKHSLPAASHSFDIQRVDIGIAICHFMSIAGGKLEVSDPNLETPKNVEYIATVIL